jgi:hypothetical protein
MSGGAINCAPTYDPVDMIRHDDKFVASHIYKMARDCILRRIAIFIFVVYCNTGGAYENGIIRQPAGKHIRGT